MNDDIEYRNLTEDDMTDDPILEFTEECSFCSTGYQGSISLFADESTQRQMVDQLKADGWVFRTSEKYQCESLCCDSCKNLPDEEL